MPKVKSKPTEDAAKSDTDGSLVERVEKLELEMSELREVVRNQRAVRRPGPDDWKRTIGIFKDDPTSDEAVRLGRAYRRQQPKC